ncbi:MAG TPA: POTRA domain-containing protein [Candidatus Sulfotelmatobacter sp.]|jgi:outer membrane protein assembly factor BamA|nr:POTRA domain-containing protein [Candidatus Sulfotelmatobacter sp.]
MRCWIISILVVLAGCLYAQCQQASQSNKVSYEGQNVATVDLVANPKISVESLRSWVQQKTNEPYSTAKIENTISALRGTGRFRDVEVDVKPDPGGLHVTFTLQPALYFGVFDFPGATKKFSYTHLLQVIDIPNQTPYEKEAVSKAGENLLQFFVSEGYFQAQIQPDPQFDETHMLANVVFHITLGKRAKVGKVEVRGPEPAEANRLLQVTRSLRATATGASLKTGKSYTPKRIDSAVALMKRDLANQHHLASNVHLDQSHYYEDSNHVDIVIDARPGPVVRVRVMGAKLAWLPFLRGRQMKKLIPIFSEGTVDPDLVEEGRRNLIDFFQSKGYFDAKVTADVETQTSQVELVYNVNRGSSHKVETVAFSGNQHVDKGELIQQVAVKPRRLVIFRGKFSDKLLRQSVSGITAYYKNRGYEDVKVDADVVDREPKIYITFHVTEGAQTVVDNLTIEGNSHISGMELAPKDGLRLRRDQPFSPKSLADDRSHIMAVYLDQGFLNAEFESKVTPLPDDRHRVRVTYAITEKQQVHVDEVLLLGNKQTRHSLMTKTANIAPEAPLSRGVLLNSESKLNDIGIFDWASVEPRRPITDQNNEDVLVKVHEAGNKEVTYGFGLEVARRGGNLPSGTIALPGLPPVTGGAPNFTAAEKTFVSPRGSIGFTRYNVRGLAETASVSLLLARLDQRALATFAQPHFRGSSWSSLYSASIERTTENPTFAARLADASWQLEKPLNKDKTRRIQLRYRFRRTDLSNLLIPGLVLPEDQRLRLSTLSATWIRDTRDKPLDASRGFYETLDLGITPKALGSNANFARFLGQSSYYKPMGKTVWANRITLGLAESFGNSDVPTSERFFSGGETTLRGFPINGAGPQRTVPACSNPNDPATCVNLQVPVGGNQLFIFNSEFRFPLAIKKGLGAAVFYDGGNVYGPIGVGHFIHDYTNTVGVGLRYNTPVGPIRFDIGRNLNPVIGVKATQFYITIGQAF